MKALIGNLALAAGSVLLLLLLIELGFRIAGYSTLSEIYAKAHQFYAHDAILGWAHRKSVTDTFVGPLPWPVEYETRVSLNALGLRGPELTPRQEGGLRILFTGDSRTAGFEVEDDETFSALLAGLLEERLGRPVQTLNAGVRGYGTDQSLLAFRERWRALDPNLVVHMHSFNDPVDNTVLHAARRVYGKAAFQIEEDGNLGLVGTPVPIYPRCAELRIAEAAQPVSFDTSRTRFFCGVQLAAFDPSALLSFVQARLEQTPDLLSALRALRTPERLKGEQRSYPGSETRSDLRNEPRYELTRRLLRLFAEEVRQSGARFVVAGYGAGLAELGASELRLAGLEVVDVSSIEDGDAMAIRFVNDGHWNTLGHRRVAEALAPHLATQLTVLHRADAQSRVEPVAAPAGSAPQ